MMKKNEFIARSAGIMFLGSLCLSCESISIDPYEAPQEDKSRTLYAAAVEYPTGYNWRRDSLGGSVEANVLFFKEGELTLRIKADAVNNVGTDPDMHRILGGHIYLDYSTEKETVIKRDGLELFRFAGRETVSDMYLTDSALFTIGEARDGTGWCFRRDGKELIRGKNGYVLGKLYEDKAEICFAYLETIQSSGGAQALERYYFVHGTKVDQLSLGADEERLLAVRRWNGEMNTLAVTSRSSGLLWQQGPNAMVVDVEGASDSRNHTFFPLSGELVAHAQLRDGESPWFDSFWSWEGKLASTVHRGGVYALSYRGDKLSYAVSYESRASELAIWYDGHESILPEKYAMMSPYAIDCDSISSCIGLNDTEDSWRPVLIRGRDTVRFDFNGYFTRLEIK